VICRSIGRERDHKHVSDEFLETKATFPQIRVINKNFLGYEIENVGPPGCITEASRKSEVYRSSDQN
jgi:hypothetical protein